MPFAGYKDFAACVAKNSGKSNPKAYCATIMRATEALSGIKPITMKMESQEVDRPISDLFDVSEATFSVEENTNRMFVDMVLLKAGRSKNPRNYQEQAVKRAAESGMFNGVRMFLNHSTTPPLKRPISDMVSAVESTSWSPERKAMLGRVEIFNKDFYDFAQRAKNYIGGSIKALVRGDRVREPDGTVVEDINEIVHPQTVDWVVYPAAGGEILQFAAESEGDEVEWDKITVDDIRTNAPDLWSAIAEAVVAANPPKKGEKKVEEGETLTKEEIATLVADAITQHETQKSETAQKADQANHQVSEAVEKSGLPERVRRRLLTQLSTGSFDEKVVSEAIDDAKEELKTLGVGPHITGMGTSSSETGTTEAPTISVSEAVSDVFGYKPKEAAKA